MIYQPIIWRNDEVLWNRRWNVLQELSSRQVQEKEWQEIKQHMKWLYERIKLRDLALEEINTELYKQARRADSAGGSNG